MSAGPQVELLLVADCPHADGARALLAQALVEVGVTVTPTERIGNHPSPTIVVDGFDVMTGDCPPDGASCRLDQPTLDRVCAALRHSMTKTGSGPANG